MKPWAAHWILFNCDFVTERGFHICIITLKEPENLTVISLREETAKRRRHDAMRSSVHPRAGVIVLTGGKLTMGFFDFLKGPDINQGIAEYRGTQGAVLLDVRTAQEYRGGHIPGSKNIPLQSLGRAGDFAGTVQSHQYYIILILIYRINIRDQRNFFQESG